MFQHVHPYPPFIPKNSSTLIVGTIPPPRFSGGILFPDDVDFCYGSKYGLLWPLLDEIFNLKLEFKNNTHSISQRKLFLKQNNIGICDLVQSCKREKIDASDLGMKNIILRDLIFHIRSNPKIHRLLFMGGNSKNGPEYLFRKILRKKSIQLHAIPKSLAKTHQFEIDNRTITTISLISPSNAANRSIGANPIFKDFKSHNDSFTTFDFRLMTYKNYFLYLI